MKQFFRNLAVIFRKTWVWSLTLVLVLALLVWFVGPLLAVADHKFWAPATTRLVTLSALFLCWGLFIVFVSWRSGVRKKRALETEDGQERLRRHEQITEEQQELRSRFKDALQTLKSSSLYRARSERWKQELPWYLVIGPQGSGKTSLLDFSGLEFPLNRDANRLTKDVGGTRHCDWYFADHGVLVDTAGRYLSQPDATVDASTWQMLLTLLRRRRRARPLNGVLVTVPVDQLLNGTEIELETLARQIRARLHDIHQQLKVDVPVYLVLSKADQVLGFEEFFDQLSREESEQVFGTSFRKEQNATDAAVVRQEFEELLRRLNTQVIQRIHQERDTLRRGRILDFPHQLALIGERLCLFIELAFSGNRYQRASQLRGFYLTSAPQLVNSLDPSTMSIGRNLGLPSNALPTYRTGHSRFIHQLLSRVIFPEADLAGLDQRETSRISWGQRGLYAGAAACLGLFGVLWATGFSANHDRLEQLRTLGQQLNDQHKTLTPSDDAMAALKSLDSAYVAANVFPAASDVALHERSGLYQGNKARPTLQQAYHQELVDQLLPRVARQLEEQIHANLNDRERLLGSLRAYLMLNLEERRDNGFLKDWVAADWSTRYSGDTVVQNGLNSHFARLLEQSFTRYPLNDALVAQARQILRSESLANVVYRMLRDQASSLPAYRFSQHLGPQGAVYGGADYAIPGFYTQKGYEQTFTTQGINLVRNIIEDNWVLGESDGLSGMDLKRLMVELEQLYFNDYANYWSEAVTQLVLAPIGDANQGAMQLSALTASNSPLLQVLNEIRDNTRFQSGGNDAAAAIAEAAPKGNAKLAKAAALASAAADKAGDALAKNLPDTAKKALQKRFEPLHRLLDDNGGPAADMVPVMAALNDLQLQMAGLAHASAPEQAAFEMARDRMAGQRDAINSLRNAANRLPQPVNNWLSLLADDSWMMVLNDAYDYLNQRYQSEMYSFYNNALNKRYPFKADSESDVAIADFREFFKMQGVADKFFDSYLKPFVSGDSGNYRLRSIDGHSLPLSREFLAQMGRVQTIRRSFFAENPAEPQVMFKLEPYSLDSSLTRANLRIGNNQMEYRHGPIVQTAFRWPAENDESRVSLVLEELNGRRVGVEQNSGPWSLFRMLDAMKIEQNGSRDALMVKADLEGLHASYLLLSQRSPNPFDVGNLRGFKLPASL